MRVRIVCLDSIQVPSEDNLPPLRQLVATAMAEKAGCRGLEDFRQKRRDQRDWNRERAAAHPIRLWRRT